jgi:hypothetical protein
MDTIQLIELIGVVPIVGSIAAVWVKMNSLVSKQEVKIGCIVNWIALKLR